MDEQNIHHFWGISPGIDLTSIHPEDTSNCDSTKILQVCPSDCRHTLHSLARFVRRNNTSACEDVSIFVFEDNPESLARHLTLLCILLDQTVPPEERVHTFLEVLGNAFIQQKTARYLRKLGRDLEKVALSCRNSNDKESGCSRFSHNVRQFFDFSALSFQERDLVAEVLSSYASEDAFDMERAWDLRSRKLYKTQYDHRENQMDWDYWMRLCTTEGSDHLKQCIIHRKEFIHWRSTGEAFQLPSRDETDCEANLSLVSNVEARTKEFKNRYGKDIGRKVVARGYWGDIVNSPYHTFGTTSEDKSLFEKANKEFKHTAMEVALFNLTRLVEDLSPLLKSYSEANSDKGGLKQEMTKTEAFKIVFLAGDFNKKVTNNKKLRGQFDVVYLSWQQIQRLEETSGLGKLTKDCSSLICEDLHGLLSVQKEKKEELKQSIVQKVEEQGWKRQIQLPCASPGVSQYFMLFNRDPQIR